MIPALATAITDDEPEHTLNAHQHVSEILSHIVELSFSTAMRIWRVNANAAGVFGLDLTIRRWADANDHRVYVEADDHRIEVIRRRDHRTIVVYLTDDPHKGAK